eukprot:scaffold272357_cov22-Prasinocladus_malaysianus.AAC.1
MKLAKKGWTTKAHHGVLYAPLTDDPRAIGQRCNTAHHTVVALDVVDGLVDMQHLKDAIQGRLGQLTTPTRRAFRCTLSRKVVHRSRLHRGGPDSLDIACVVTDKAAWYVKEPMRLNGITDMDTLSVHSSHLASIHKEKTYYKWQYDINVEGSQIDKHVSGHMGTLL